MYIKQIFRGKMWKGTLFKEELRAMLPQLFRVLQQSSDISSVIANYKFSEKIKYLKP